MNIIIAGDGKAGFTPAENLSQEKNDVTITDTDPVLEISVLVK